MTDECGWQGVGKTRCSKELVTNEVTRDGFVTIATRVTICTQHEAAWQRQATKQGYRVQAARDAA